MSPRQRSGSISHGMLAFWMIVPVSMLPLLQRASERKSCCQHTPGPQLAGPAVSQLRCCGRKAPVFPGILTQEPVLPGLDPERKPDMLTPAAREAAVAR
jgi:hypothetical protein